jgi:hypothetical protein
MMEDTELYTKLAKLPQCILATRLTTKHPPHYTSPCYRTRVNARKNDEIISFSLIGGEVPPYTDGSHTNHPTTYHTSHTRITDNSLTQRIKQTLQSGLVPL